MSQQAPIRVRIQLKNPWLVFFEWVRDFALPGFSEITPGTWAVDFEGANTGTVSRELHYLKAFFPGRKEEQMVEIGYSGYDSGYPCDAWIVLRFPLPKGASLEEWKFFLRNDLPGDPEVVFFYPSQTTHDVVCAEGFECLPE